MSRHGFETPVYQQIAVDIASKIVSGKFQLGEKIKGRSALASFYNVSPETIRKSMCILEDIGAVCIRAGIGVEIVSADRAKEFLENYSNVSNLNTIKQNILDLISEQTERERRLKETVDELLDCTERFRDMNPFTPFEVEIHKGMRFLGKTIGEINFWQNTTATIIAIKHGGKLMLSPGPYATLKEHDVLYIIANEESYHRVKQFLGEAKSEGEKA